MDKNGIAAACFAASVSLFLAGCTGSGGVKNSAPSPTSPSPTSSGAPHGNGDPVYANYSGRWDGDYQVTGCTASGGISTDARLCNEFPAGAWLPMTVVLSQTISNVSSGPLFLGSVHPDTGSYRGNVVGVVGSNRALTLYGLLQGIGLNYKTYSVQITSWTSTLNGNQLTSTWSMDFRQDGETGMGTVTATAPGLEWHP